MQRPRRPYEYDVVYARYLWLLCIHLYALPYTRDRETLGRRDVGQRQKKNKQKKLDIQKKKKKSCKNESVADDDEPDVFCGGKKKKTKLAAVGSDAGPRRRDNDVGTDGRSGRGIFFSVSLSRSRRKRRTRKRRHRA